MKKVFFFTAALILSVVQMSCGTKQAAPSGGTGTQSGDAKLILQVFAGYSCASCNEELPLLNQKLTQQLKGKSNLLDSRVYVVAGPNWSKATQEVADRYGRELGLTEFSMYTDNRCQGEYRKYYPGSSCLVPATVLLRPNGEVVDIYEPGVLNMDEFLARIQELISE